MDKNHINNSKHFERSHRKSGISLIELSIVIVIGGIIMVIIMDSIGMIEKARMRAVISDFNKYTTAYHSFDSKYDAIPGDMPTAYAFWKKDCSAYPLVCNGNGNSMIEYSNDFRNELNTAWKHLELSGVVEKTFQTISPVGKTKLNLNAPESSIPGAGFQFMNRLIYINVLLFPPESNNFIALARESGDKMPLQNSSVTPIFAYNIDAKIDDAYKMNDKHLGAYTGKFRTFAGADATAFKECTNPSGEYLIAEEDEKCIVTITLEIPERTAIR